jgi:hypothetical protein
VAWNEESIREENEWAENDEIMSTQKSIRPLNLKRVNDRIHTKLTPVSD